MDPVTEVKQDICIDMVKTLCYAKAMAENTTAEQVRIKKQYSRIMFYTPTDLHACKAFQVFSENVFPVKIHDKVDTSTQYNILYDTRRRYIDLHM